LDEAMQIEAGDGWELRCGDCLDRESGLPSLGDGSASHVITDPPYDQMTHAGARESDAARSSSIDFAALDHVDAGPYIRIASRWCIAFCSLEMLAGYKKSAGDAWVRAGLWVRANAMPQITGDRPAQAADGIAIMHRPGKKRWNGGGRAALWRFSTEQGDARVHPTQKPVSLMEKLIRDFTEPGDLICDPFAGSGTTGVAAIRLGRRFLGWEREDKYFAAAVKRLRATKEQLELIA
jgi:site-specific DNA-methyltransferase (adenine-specific)